MTQKTITYQKKKFFLILMVSLFFSNLIMSGIALGQQSSSIQVTRSPYLYFTSIPSTIQWETMETSYVDSYVFSDPGASNLSSTTRLLKIHDARNCGGFTLQASMNEGLTASGNPVPIPKSNIWIVSSTRFSPSFIAVVRNNIVYFDVTGQEGVIAPVATPSTDFGNQATFTEINGNTLDNVVDIMQGALTSPQGRRGDMAVGLSFMAKIPPYTKSGAYEGVITYTLSDATTGSCS